MLRLMGNAATAAARVAGKQAVRSLTRTQSVSGSSSAPLTGNFDYKTDYRKKRLTRRQRFRQRRWRRRNMKMVKFVREVNIGSSHIVRRQIGSYTSSTDSSGIAGVGMYGLNGTSGDANNANDIASLFTDIDSTAWGAANNPLVVGPQHRIRSHHATMEVTVNNVGTTDIILEAYFIRGRKPLPSEFGNPAQLYVDGFLKQGRAGDPDIPNNTIGTSELGASVIGVTPFQNAAFCRHFLIYKRQKFRIPANNEVSMIIHDRRPRTFSMIDSRNNATDRRYHGIVFQWQGAPGMVSTTPVTATPSQLVILAVKRYRLKMIRDDETKDAFDPNA